MHHDLDIRWDTASERNLRAVNADAVATRRDPASGELVFAVADGIGDTPRSAEAARKAVTAAVATPVAQGAIQAMLAAQQALLLDEDDCVLIVAMPFTDRVSSGYRIAWVGDCRAYLWDDRTLHQLTSDQTVAAYLRSQLRPTTPRMEHIVTNTVRTTSTDQIGWTQVRTNGSGLLLANRRRAQGRAGHRHAPRAHHLRPPRPGPHRRRRRPRRPRQRQRRGGGLVRRPPRAAAGPPPRHPTAGAPVALSLPSGTTATQGNSRRHIRRVG